MSEQDLTDVARADLRALLRAVETGNLVCPFDESGLQFAGLGRLGVELRCLQGLGKEALVTVLKVVLAEREQASADLLDLVWTGPEGLQSGSRDTAVVLRELFAAAQDSVLLAGYSFDHGAEILRSLHEGMRDRSVACRVVMDVPRVPVANMDSESHARATVDSFVATNWPFGKPLPEFYFDPRTALPTSVVSMHAKCAVIDARHTVLTSANFTDRGQTRNIECGVVIHDSGFAHLVLSQWQGLISAGLLRRVSRA